MKKTKKLYIAIGIIVIVALGVVTYGIKNRSLQQKVLIETSWATSYYDISELVEASDVIALVKVKGINKQHRMTGFPMIDFDVEVTEMIYGDCENNHLVVTQTGGIVNDVIYEISDDPLLQIGEEYLIFGRNNQIGTITILGGPQGRYVYNSGKLNSLFSVSKRSGGVDTTANFLSTKLDFRNTNADNVFLEIKNCIEK